MSDKTTKLPSDNYALVILFWGAVLLAIVGAGTFFCVSGIVGSLMMVVGATTAWAMLAIGERLANL